MKDFLNERTLYVVISYGKEYYVFIPDLSYLQSYLGDKIFKGISSVKSVSINQIIF